MRHVALAVLSVSASVGLLAFPRDDRFVAEAGAPFSTRENEAVRLFTSLPGDHFDKLKHLRSLHRKRDMVALLAIAKLDEWPASDAAYHLCELLESKQAVAFCRRQPHGSSRWMSAFWALSRKDRAQVMPYIMEVYYRGGWHHYCYRVCANGGWDDMVEYAWADQTNETRFGEANQHDLTFGDCAETYLRTIAELKGEPPPPIKRTRSSPVIYPKPD